MTEAQVIALEKAKTEKEAHGEFESECPGYCGAQDTFKLSSVLTDRGSEYCGNPEHHEYELYLAWKILIIPGPRPRARMNGICERFHKTILNEFYRVAFRKKLYASIEDLQNGSRSMDQKLQ